MKYKEVVQGYFLERPNRFVAYVELEGRIEKCHVKNTGRCRELLIPGREVWLEKNDNPNRRTAWDLIAVNKEGNMINMDSQAPNKAVREWLESSISASQDGFSVNREFFSNVTCVRPEYRYGSSRIDFYVETGGGKQPQKILIEVKGVTLEEDGIARFPDAPTERGIKHMVELERAMQEGYQSYLFFVIQMKGIRWFEPNDMTHPQFGETLRNVEKSGVKVLAYDCKVTEKEMTIDMPVQIRLQRSV